MDVPNVYDDAERAAAYATLDLPGTYYLAYRDLPGLIASHVDGRRALDFGCGTGRSTRFLERLGFDVTGIDISKSMIELARSLDPSGDYRLISDGDFRPLEPERFDLILAAYPFDNIADVARRQRLLRGLAALLTGRGRVVILGSSAEIYTHEWTSFTTSQFPENRKARSGDTVRIVMKDVPDARPVVDVFWRHEDYLALFDEAGLALVAQHAPLGRDEEPFSWVSETTVPPWMIYVLARRTREGR